MPPSRGLRAQAQANAHQAEHDEFNAMLLAALEDPEIVQAIAESLRRIQIRRQVRNGPSITSTGAARDLKAQRLAARGRQQRG